MNSCSTSWWSLLLINRPREDERLSWPCWLTIQRTVYPYKWLPISCRSGADQWKFAGQRPTFYHLTTQPTIKCASSLQVSHVVWYWCAAGLACIVTGSSRWFNSTSIIVQCTLQLQDGDGELHVGVGQRCSSLVSSRVKVGSSHSLYRRRRLLWRTVTARLRHHSLLYTRPAVIDVVTDRYMYWWKIANVSCASCRPVNAHS